LPKTEGSPIEEHKCRIRWQETAFDVLAPSGAEVAVRIEQTAGKECILMFVGDDKLHPQLTFEDRPARNVVPNGLVKNRQCDGQRL